MNDKQAEAMLKSLKRIESFLEAIDWKLWTFHQKAMGTSDNSTEESSLEDEETEQLAAVIDTPKSKPVAEAKKSAGGVGYPTIEKWS